MKNSKYDLIEKGVVDRVENALAMMTNALIRIAEIENKYDGGDWEEIDEARNIAAEDLDNFEDLMNGDEDE